MLLVLDNFEQILPAAPFVGELLAAAPRLWILATSRAPLRLAAEREYPVPPFDAPDAGLPFEALVKTDAVRLFAARAQAVDPGFELDTASAPEVAQRLQAPRRTAARDRAGGGARQAARAGRDPGAAGTRAEHAPGGPARRAGTPADARRHDPLELRPARPGGAPGLRAPRRLRRRLHARGRRRRVRRDAREPRQAGGQQPPAAPGRPFHDARDGPPLRRRAARGGRRRRMCVGGMPNG